MVHGDNLRRFGFVLVPGFSLLALSCAIDALRAANVDTDAQIYEWMLLGVDGDEIQSSSNVPLSVHNLDQAPPLDVIAVCGGDRSHEFANAKLNRWLHGRTKQNTMIGSISDGAFIVADAGLFAGHRSTIHWKCLDAYRERFPALDIRASIMEVDNSRFSCAGGTASLDLMLNFIIKDLGPEAVTKIADNYFHDTIRDDQQIQHLTAYRYAGRNSDLSKALLIMQDNLEKPLTISRIAAGLAVSHRQLDRIFRTHLNVSPAGHYRSLRLGRAGGLLRQTGLSVAEIAVGCGFQSASHLSRHFVRQYGQSPGRYRRLDS